GNYRKRLLGSSRRSLGHGAPRRRKTAEDCALPPDGGPNDRGALLRAFGLQQLLQRRELRLEGLVLGLHLKGGLEVGMGLHDVPGALRLEVQAEVALSVRGGAARRVGLDLGGALELRVVADLTARQRGVVGRAAGAVAKDEVALGDAPRDPVD